MRNISKFFILTLCLVCLSLALSSYAEAADKSEARITLENTLNDVLGIISKPEFKNSATNAQLMQQVKDKIYALCDFQEFSARTIGGRWRSFTPDQQKNFIDAFSELLFQTYSGKLLAYNGQKINFLGETTSSKGDKVEIETTIPYEGQQAPINYRMIKKSGGWKVYDLIVENIGFVQNYRNQFQDILNKQTPDQLIDTIREKAKEAKEKNDAINK